MALSDPVNVAIIDELWAVPSKAPGPLAAAVQQRSKLSRPVISTHITQLVERFVLERHDDGSVGLTDREPIALILQTAREFSDAAHTQAAKDERSAHYLSERRLGKARRELSPHLDELLGPTGSVADLGAPLDDTGRRGTTTPERIEALARRTSQGSADTASDPEDATVAIGSAATQHAVGDAQQPPDPPSRVDAETEEARRIAAAGFPYPPGHGLRGRPGDPRRGTGPSRYRSRSED
jgi:hypothetical protein